MKQPTKLWEAWKQVLPQGKSSVEMLELNDAGNVLNTNKSIASHFDFFSTVGKKLSEKFRGVKSKIENPYGNHGNSFSYTEVTSELIKQGLDSLNVKNWRGRGGGRGLDEISPKKMQPRLLVPLWRIFFLT